MPPLFSMRAWISGSFNDVHAHPRAHAHARTCTRTRTRKRDIKDTLHFLFAAWITLRWKEKWGGGISEREQTTEFPRQSELLRDARALWSGSTKNRDVSTGPLARPFSCSLAPLTRLLAPDCSLRSRPPLCSRVRLLAHFTHSLARGKVNF